MKTQHQLNIEEALATLAKLEQLIRMCDIYSDERNLDEIFKKLYKMYQEETKKARWLTAGFFFCLHSTILQNWINAHLYKNIIESHTFQQAHFSNLYIDHK